MFVRRIATVLNDPESALGMPNDCLDIQASRRRLRKKSIISSFTRLLSNWQAHVLTAARNTDKKTEGAVQKKKSNLSKGHSKGSHVLTVIDDVRNAI